MASNGSIFGIGRTKSRNAGENGPLHPVDKERAQGMKMETPGWHGPPETHIETSKEYLPETFQDRGRGSGLQVSNPDPKTDSPASDAKIRLVFSSRRNSANTTKHRGENDHGRKSRSSREYNSEEYPSTASEDETDTEADGAVDSRHRAIIELERTIKMTKAARLERARLDRQPKTPDSYPGTSDGQPTRQVIGLNDNSSPNAPPNHEFAAERVRDSVDPPDWSSREHRGCDTHLPPVDLPRNFQQQDMQADGLDEHGARQMVNRAQEYHKAHHARKSSEPPPIIPRKPTTGSTLPHHTRPSTAEPADMRQEPHNHKAYNTLGLPYSLNSAHFDTQMHDAARHREMSAQTQGSGYRPLSNGVDSNGTRQHTSATTLEGGYPLDYDFKDLYAKPFNSLLNEPFDYDPRQPRDLEASPINVNRKLEHLLKPLDLSSADSITAAEHFFGSLTLGEWQATGKWIVDESAKSEKTLAQKREEKREIAKKFEAEVAKRERAVMREKGEIDGIMGEMKKSGAGVLKVGSPAGSQKRRR